MQKIPFSARAAIRWLALAVVCFGIATVGKTVILYQLTRWGRLVCPEGWWRSSPGICAFPPVSISIWSLSYAAVSTLLLCAAVVLAPAHKLRVCATLLMALVCWQASVLIFNAFSWVALGSLCAALGIATCFSLGALASHNTRSGDKALPIRTRV
ncbi:hypothetical protein [Acidovorax sp. Leaf78]|uniref:hypothetical protein n=1 Tax=Acidovorax sp. Leaf78 TaxID=1736237 RepID=UPI0006F46E00|nr:hypothetical protein [Acidovorax sp. Leaf78]KQO19584.1 hypothetical protein ASF16_06340 [Acidovorax sp. Leaf78]RZJ62444.1 MAG: hypothetical protein EON49_02200 [Acidovorax sp.]